MSRAAIYIRVSTDEQATKGNSLQEQRERLIAYSRAMGWDEYEIFEDDGYSAKNTNRPKLKNLLSRLDEFDFLVTTKLDRLCRNLLDLLTIIEILEAQNCSYVSSSESFDTSTPAGRMVLQILGAFAEFERERISERVKDNLMSLAKNTDTAISKPCYGYDIKNGEYIIIEKEAEAIRKMVEWTFEGIGSFRIADMLNKSGYRTKKGKHFAESTIRKILRTETISGEFIYNRRFVKKNKVQYRPKEDWIVKPNHHPAIIDPETFIKLQEALDARKVGNRQSSNEEYLLSGIVYCGHCGSKMVGSIRRKPNKSYIRYICQGYFKKKICFHHYIYRDDIEFQTIKYLSNLKELFVSDLIVEDKTSSRSDNDNLDIDTLEKQLEKINKKMQKQISLYEDDDISIEDFRSAKERIEIERKKIQEQISNVQGITADKLKQSIIDKSIQFQNHLNSENRLLQKNAIRQIGPPKITVFNGKEVIIDFDLTI